MSNINIEEINKYQLNVAKLAALAVEQHNLAAEIINKYCKYRKGDWVEYKYAKSSRTLEDESKASSAKSIMRHDPDFGIIDTVVFKGGGEDAVDGLWHIMVRPADRHFRPLSSSPINNRQATAITVTHSTNTKAAILEDEDA